MSTAGFSAGATLVIAFHYALGYFNVLNFAICLVGDVIFFFFFFWFTFTLLATVLITCNTLMKLIVLMQHVPPKRHFSCFLSLHCRLCLFLVFLLFLAATWFT